LFQLLILYFRVFFLSLLFSRGSFFSLSARTKKCAQAGQSNREPSSLLPPAGDHLLDGSNN
jgi:hypothetical protein